MGMTLGVPWQPFKKSQILEQDMAWESLDSERFKRVSNSFMVGALVGWTGHSFAAE